MEVDGVELLCFLLYSMAQVAMAMISVLNQLNCLNRTQISGHLDSSNNRFYASHNDVYVVSALISCLLLCRLLDPCLASYALFANMVDDVQQKTTLGVRWKRPTKMYGRGKSTEYRISKSVKILNIVYPTGSGRSKSNIISK